MALEADTLIKMKPKHHNRRRHFLVQKPLQFRYVFYTIVLLLIVCGAGMIGMYYGIWASTIQAFSTESVQETLTNAAHVYDYNEARHPSNQWTEAPSLRHFRETELLSARQKEMIRQILDNTRRQLIWLGSFLFIMLGWGSIFLTHKVAGPLYRFDRSFETIKAGDLRVRANLRRFDEAKNIARSFNEMAFSLDKKIGRMKQAAARTSGERALEDIRKELSEFTTSADET